MGYTIRIGNAVVESEWSSYDEPYACWTVERSEHSAAPNSQDSGQWNERSPSYTGWADFARATGLNDFFFDKAGYGKMRRHPGCFKLNEDDAKKVEDALANYRLKHPNAVAGFCECYGCSGRAKTPPVQHDPNADGNLVRLEWLAFWVRLAVETCEHPAIYNS